MISSYVTKNFQIDKNQTLCIHPLSHYFYPCYHKGFLAIIFMSKIDNNLYEIVYFIIIGQKVHFYFISTWLNRFYSHFLLDNIVSILILVTKYIFPSLHYITILIICQKCDLVGSLIIYNSICKSSIVIEW